MKGAVMFHWRKRHPTQLHPEWPSSGKEVLIGFLHHYSPQMLKANLTLDLLCKKRLSTSFAKADGEKKNDWEDRVKERERERW